MHNTLLSTLLHVHISTFLVHIQGDSYSATEKHHLLLSSML